MSIGTRNERDEVYIVSGYQDWAKLENSDTKIPNGISFYFPRLEYYTQIIHFLLEITLIKVIERLAKLALMVTFFTWLVGLWKP
ncbi:hypothetical protein EOD23_11205 [Mesorhizobium sp. USDA-HM6]|nr:hypothetical protein EOD23_11205 [Mesorhizobium sp. USDA-HM6]